MSEQTREKELEERLYNKLLAKIQNNNNNDTNAAEKVKKPQTNNKQIDEGCNETTKKDGKDVWRCIGSGQVAKDAPSDDDDDDEDPSVFKLQQDMYAVLATASWKSLPFGVSILVIFGFQYVLGLMLLANKADWYSEDNKMMLPANVETSVRVGQVMVLIIAVFRQRDLLESIAKLVRDLPDHFRGNSNFRTMTRFQWRLAATIQLIQALLNFSLSFILVNQSQTVPQVILTVLGVVFISDLDEFAFELCTEGYLGGTMKRQAKDVCDVRFHRTTQQQKVKKDAHIIGAVAFLVLSLAGFTYLAIRQESGVYSVNDIRIEFGDEVLPFLGLFNGCYQKSESIEHMGGRLVYEQVGYPNGGKFGFCSGFGKGAGGWIFYIGGDNKGEGEICENYILRSGSTSTFNLLEAAKTSTWYTYNNLAIDFLEITENKSPSTECGQKIFDSSTKDACPSILAFDTMSMTKLSPSANEAAIRSKRTSLDAAFSHPIYYSNNNDENDGGYTLLFYTGRRWIRTNSDYIHGLGNETSVSHMQDFFFQRNGLFKVIEQIRTSADWKAAELVNAVSEIVDTKRDQGSPLGLLWYWPRYGDTVNNVVAPKTETDKLQRNFPSANLARPIVTSWTCLKCNEETNPCYYDGICNPHSGTCECKHGATGNLCQEPPLGNGICNLYFNTAVFNYDGGDCCGGTCRGVDCGKDDLPDPFSDIADAYVDEDGWYFPFLDNKTEEWKETFRGRKFAFGVDIVGNEDLSMEISSPPIRFSHCVDPNTTLLTIEQDGYILESGRMLLAETTVRCDGSQYLQTPRFDFEITENQTDFIFREEIRIPHGKRCEFRVWDDEIEVSIFAENSPFPFVQQESDPNGAPISVRIPESECAWNAFVEYQIPPEFTYDEYQEFVGGVDLDSMCNRDPGEVLDRYLVWKIMKSVSGTNGTPMNFDGHICDNIEWPGLGLSCGDVGLRVASVWDIGCDTFPPELWRLTQLTYLSQNDRAFTSLPSEIGRLTSLLELNLTANQLTWIPPEIGALTSLISLELRGNELTWLPSEMGSLVSLALLDLMNNQLTWIPSEMGRLTSLTTLDLDNNELTSIPTEMGSLTALSEFYLEGNYLESLPSEIGNLRSVSSLSLEYNPMTWESLPVEVQELQSSGTHIDICDYNFGEDGCIES